MSRQRQGPGAPGLLASWLASAAPDAAVEIAPHAVSVALLGSRGAQPVVNGFAVVPVPPGAIVASLLSHNIVDAPAVAEALRTACERAGQRPRRAALVIPDTAARVSLVRFDNVPARREDLDQLIRWQVKKSSPFPMEEACVTHSPGARSGDGGEFVVVSARQATVREYEAVCDSVGIYAGLVDLATLNVVNLYLAGGSPPAGDWLIVHRRPQYTSIAIMRDDDLIYFRSRPEGDEESLSDVVHQTAMYYQDRLAGEGFTRVIAGGSAASTEAETVRRDLEQRVGRTVEPLDPTAIAVLSDRVTVPEHERALLAPLVGILLRAGREAAAA